MTRDIIRSEERATATEYGIMVVLIALGILLGAAALGGALDGLFTDASEEVAFTG